MPEQMVGFNTTVLTWARERAGLSLEDVANKLHKDQDTIEKWELGEEAPTYVQLEKLAYEILKCPLAVFFFPTPPDEADLRKSFRTLPDSELAKLTHDTLLAIRYAAAMQISLYEINEGTNPADNIIFKNVKLGVGDDIRKACRSIRNFIGISVGQQKACSKYNDALKMWRDAVSRVGIFIFKRSMRQREISGFSIYDNEFPVIMVNNSNAFSRQIFTIFHELSHLLLGNNGITQTDTSYVFGLDKEEKAIEVFCNQVAAESLVPTDDFEQYIHLDPDNETVSELANLYKVSREVILRKYYDVGKVNGEQYREIVFKWNAQLEGRGSANGPGGNYYATKAAYLGEQYIRLAFNKYYSGGCSLEQLADYLDVKPNNVQRLEDYLMRGAA